MYTLAMPELYSFFSLVDKSPTTHMSWYFQQTGSQKSPMVAILSTTTLQFLSEVRSRYLSNQSIHTQHFTPTSLSILPISMQSSRINCLPLSLIFQIRPQHSSIDRYRHSTSLLLTVSHSSGHSGFIIEVQLVFLNIYSTLSLYSLYRFAVSWLNFFTSHFSFSIIGAIASVYLREVLSIEFSKKSPNMPMRMCSNLPILPHSRQPFRCVLGNTVTNHLRI